MKKFSDQEIIEIIKKLLNGEGNDKDIANWEENELFGLDEVYDLIFYSKEKLTPEEILNKAREMNKVILL